MLTSPARLSGAMNNFFISKVNMLRERIPPTEADPLAKLTELMQDRKCSFSLRPITPEEVLKLITGLKNSKSTGVDFIDTWVVKLAAREILPALTHIVNLSISHSEFPSLWKIAKVVPLLKKGDPLNAKNFRPVALLPIFSKIMEKAVFQQLIEYLDSNRLLNPNHHGARHGHNTATALIQMYDQWAEQVDDGMMVGVMLIDLSAAFDMVDHPLLLKKLELFGLDVKAVNWFQSYLSTRSQSVCIDGCLSPAVAIECGVPQGSILGPLLYILFTDDIPELVHDHPVSVATPAPFCSECGSTVCYVDDCTYSHGSKDPVELSERLSIQYSRISSYMAANKLVINADKTHLLVMGTKSTAARRAEVSFQADQHTVTPTSTEKLLGANIFQDLKWKEHLLGSRQSLVNQLTSRINGLLKVSARSPVTTRLMVANGIFMSKLCYLIQLWGGVEKYLLKALQVLQNRAARAVTRKSWFTSTRVLLRECNWLSVNQLVFYQTVLTTHKIVTSGTPLYLARKMSLNHPYRTRQATEGSIRFGEAFEGTSSITGNSFCYTGTLSYNSLPACIRAVKTLQTFKFKLKKWIHSNIPID